jgi:hypothetical protein
MVVAQKITHSCLAASNTASGAHASQALGSCSITGISSRRVHVFRSLDDVRPMRGGPAAPLVPPRIQVLGLDPGLVVVQRRPLPAVCAQSAKHPVSPLDGKKVKRNESAANSRAAESKSVTSLIDV